MQQRNMVTASGSARIADMEDYWWDNGAQPKQAPGRQTRPRRRTQQPPIQSPGRRQSRQDQGKAERISKMLMYTTLAVLVVCLFLQVNRYAQIASQTKRISTMVNEIKQLETDKANLELRLSARANIDRVRDEAVHNLGMDYPNEGQVRVVALGEVTAETLALLAANSADSAQ